MSTLSGALAVVVAVVWGLCFVLIQAALPSPAPLLLASLRALIGGPFSPHGSCCLDGR